MKLAQEIFETQESILVGEHPSGTRVGGWHGGALFEWNEFAQPIIFVSLPAGRQVFLQCKKKAPGRDVRREALFGSSAGSTLWHPCRGLSFFLRKKKQKRLPKKTRSTQTGFWRATRRDEYPKDAHV